MLKLSHTIAVLVALSAPLAGASAAAIKAGGITGVATADPAACRPGSQRPAVLVKVDGFKRIGGNLRVQVYGGDPAQFVKGGERLARIDMPVRTAPSEVCVALPGPGRYAIAVRHDVEGDGKSGLNDGGGFSRNPGISLSDVLARRMPRYEDVAIAVGAGPRPVDIVLNYRQGLSIKPLAMAHTRVAAF
ncbi:DUF2141 domain-containing protein [Sphingomonas solaris]|uniref:DUF2141 domain-containing protein n=1 Tax=Alterirhizorhabdus solaris TaxID=2529389 RepID=A0A558RA98_9SPHN|nr:DUF2141 domain-containing protein [Sphingomonas solaris]TVV76305.1 DUF2141 domain-containing protein [Sphingomonas solaris]